MLQKRCVKSHIKWLCLNERFIKPLKKIIFDKFKAYCFEIGPEVTENVFIKYPNLGFYLGRIRLLKLRTVLTVFPLHLC